jgi:hypothetical protein
MGDYSGKFSLWAFFRHGHFLLPSFLRRVLDGVDDV